MQVKAGTIITTSEHGGLAPSTAAGEKASADVDRQVAGLTLVAAGSLTMVWTACMVWMVIEAAQWALN